MVQGAYSDSADKQPVGEYDILSAGITRSVPPGCLLPPLAHCADVSGKYRRGDEREKGLFLRH